MLAHLRRCPGRLGCTQQGIPVVPVDVVLGGPLSEPSVHGVAVKKKTETFYRKNRELHIFAGPGLCVGHKIQQASHGC